MSPSLANSEAEHVFPVGTYTEHKYTTHKSIYTWLATQIQTDTVSLTALSCCPLLAAQNEGLLVGGIFIYSCIYLFKYLCTSFIYLNVYASIFIFKYIYICRVWIQLPWISLSPVAGTWTDEPSRSHQLLVQNAVHTTKTHIHKV